MTTEVFNPQPTQQTMPVSQEIEEVSNSIIRKYTLITCGASILPYAIVDIVSSTVTQTLMVKDLCKVYKIPYQQQIKQIATWSAMGSILIKGITETLSAIVKSQSANGFNVDVTGAAVAGIYTAAVGEFFNLHFKKGGTLDDVKLTDFAEYFLEEIKRGDLSLATFTNPKVLFNHLTASSSNS